MTFLNRYNFISELFEKKLESKNNQIYLDNKEIKLIDTVPDFIANKLDKITNKMSEFYDEIKFPNYDDCEDYASLYEKGMTNLFTKRIDQELNYGINILELGCGTGQLSLFLARGNRKIFGVDISDGSLILGEKFRKDNEIDNVYFMKMDVFDLKFKKNTFDFTISNGVLHHTKDAKKAFKSLVEVTKPNGLIVIGLYHKYGRFFTRLKQKIAKIIGKSIFIFDTKSIEIKSKEKRNAWVTDQFLNPHETVHLPSEVMGWFREYGVDFVNLLPHADDIEKPIFQKRSKKSFPFLSELLMIFNRNQIKEGGFFVMVGRKH